MKPKIKIRAGESPLKIQSWSDVDSALKMLGQLDYEIESLEVKMTALIQRIQERYQGKCEEKMALAEALIEEIEQFASAHKGDFNGKQTKVLNFGEVSFRLGKISYEFLRDEQEIADDLLRLGKEDAVKITKSVIKNALKNIAEETLRKIGIKIVPGMLRWFVTPYREKIIPTDNGKKD